MARRYQSLFNNLLTKGHLGCFQFVAIMNKAAIKVCGQVFYVNISFISLGQMPRSTVAESYGSYRFIFLKETDKLFFKMAILFYTPNSILTNISASLAS